MEPMDTENNDEQNIDPDDLEWKVFTKGETGEPFHSWLQCNMPSIVSK
jgi:hypothetical protein